MCNTVFRYQPFFFEFGDPVENHTTYAVGQALSYVFLLMYVYPVKWYNDRVYRVVFWCAVSNLMDELFFDPLHLSINELVFAIGIIVYEVYKHGRDGSKTTTI